LTRRDKYGHLLLWSKTQCLSIETTLVSLCQPEANEPVDTQRLIWSSASFVEDSMSIDRDYFRLPFVNQRQASSLTHRDKYGHLLPLSKTQCLSTKTIVVSPINQRQASPLTCRDKYGHFLPLSKTQCLSTKTIAVSLVNQRQACLLTCRDKYGHLLPLSKTLPFDQTIRVSPIN